MLLCTKLAAQKIKHFLSGQIGRICESEGLWLKLSRLSSDFQGSTKVENIILDPVQEMRFYARLQGFLISQQAGLSAFVYRGCHLTARNDKY